MPKRYYAVFHGGKVIHIVLGAETARRLSPFRAYKSFRTELEAQEFMSWWNYDAVRPGGHLAHLNTTAQSAFPTRRRP